MRRMLWCLLVLAGCGDSGGSTTPMGNSVSGTVDGLTVSALGAIFARDSYDSSGVHHELAHILVGESADLCAIARRSYVGKKNSNVLTMDFEAADGSTDPVPSGDYPEFVSTGSGRSGANVIAGVVTVGTTCDWNTSNGAGGIASGGSVKLQTSTDSRMAGTFSLTFTKGQVSGSFDATSCPAFISGTDTPPCE